MGYAKHTEIPVEKDVILIPDWLNMKAWAFAGKTIERARRKMPDEDRKKMLFWRGGCADSMGHRGKLVKMGETSDVIDAKFVGAGFPSKFIQGYDHLDYLYQITLDGARCAWDRFVWQLASGSIVFKGNSPQKQWFYRGLKSGVHYIDLPVETYAIEGMIKELNADPERSKKIIANALEFSNNNLKVDHMYAYLALVIREYAKRYKGPTDMGMIRVEY